MSALSSTTISTPQKDTRSANKVLGATIGATEGAFVFPTELGWTFVRYTQDRLLRLSIGHPTALAAWSQQHELTDSNGVTNSGSKGVTGSKGVIGSEGPRWVRRLADRVQRYALGRRVKFDSVPLDQARLTEFQRRVVEACRSIPRGETWSYGQLAQAAGSPRAARAVGNVMANNRFPIIVPCHRVVASCGIGGFSAPTGLDLKRRLLALEGYRG